MKKMILLLFLFSMPLFSQIDIQATRLSDHLYKLKINFVNVVASIGPDGILLSDAGYGGSGETLQTKLQELGSEDLKYIINTHWHGDHCDGNKVLAKDKDVVIIAHNNVKKTRSVDQVLTVFWQEQYEALPDYALPDLTFSEKMTLLFNGEQIEIIHFPNGHSDGDAIVYFKNAKVVHLADLLFSDGFPAIDFEHKGNAKQWAENLKKIIDMMPADVKFIAGHGRDYTIEELKKYRDMLLATEKIVADALSKGLSLDQMKEQKILKDWESWGEKMHSCDQWIEILYYSLTHNKQAKI